MDVQMFHHSAQACAGLNRNSDAPYCTCIQGYFDDGKSSDCQPCQNGCQQCTSAAVCQLFQSSPVQYYVINATGVLYSQCPAGYYGDSSDYSCKACNSLCETCNGTSNNCQSCASGYILFNAFCYNQCPVGSYNITATSCSSCDPSCKVCRSNTLNDCLTCPQGTFLIRQNASVAYGRCTTCADVYSPPLLYSPPYLPIPRKMKDCHDICGDGRRTTADVQCDDGNNISGDGCSESCQVESGWSCSGGSQNSADTCIDLRGITAQVVADNALTLYENMDSNEPYTFQLIFSKAPIFPSNTTLANFIEIQILALNISSLPFTITPNYQSSLLLARILQNKLSVTNFTVQVFIPLTISGQLLQINFVNSENINAANGETLQAPKLEVPIYAYLYTPDSQRQHSALLAKVSWSLAIVVLVFILPLIFRQEYFRVAITIECMQYIYFLMYLNVRYSPTLMTFFNGLHPFVTLFIPNPFYQLTSTNTKDSVGADTSLAAASQLEQSSGDIDQNFLDNFGGVSLIIFLTILTHLILRAVLRIKVLPERRQNQLKVFVEGYLEWGLYFDVIQLTFFLMVTFSLVQIINLNFNVQEIFAYCFGAFSLVFFVFSVYINIAYRKRLYKPPDPYEDVPLTECMQQESYKYKQLWQGLNLKKSNVHYYYSLKFFRNFLFAATIVLITDFTIQLIVLCGFNFLVTALLAWKRPYKQRRDNARAIISELLLITGTSLLSLQQLGTLVDQSERNSNSWYSIYFFFFSLVLQVFLLLVEVFFPYLLMIYYRITYKSREVRVHNMREDTRSRERASSVGTIGPDQPQTSTANNFYDTMNDKKWSSPLQSYHESEINSQKLISSQKTITSNIVSFTEKQSNQEAEPEVLSSVGTSIIEQKMTQSQQNFTSAVNEVSNPNQRDIYTPGSIDSYGDENNSPLRASRRQAQVRNLKKSRFYGNQTKIPDKDF